MATTKDEKRAVPSDEWDVFDHEMDAAPSHDDRYRLLLDHFKTRLDEESLDWILELGERAERHALNLGTIRAQHLPDQARLLLDLSDDMIRREETSANLYYRRAFALRRLERFEILGLFVTLAGFLVGSGAVVLKATSFGQRFASMVLVLFGSLIFFVL